MSWGAVAGAAVGGIGDLLTGGYFSRKAWQRQKEAMQNQHQWEVADLRAAGLNPILSANGGASTGGLNGSMVGDTGQFSRAVQNALQGMALKGQLEKQAAEIDNINKDTELKEDQRAVAQMLYNVNRTQALINSENAYSLYRENKFWDDNQATYLIKHANDAMPGLGGLVGMAGALTNSSKGLSEDLKAVRELADHFWKRGGNGKY